VPGFVNGGVQRIAQIGLVVTRRQPHVVADARREGMHGFVETSLVEIESDALGHQTPEAPLRIDREMAAQRRRGQRVRCQTTV